MKTSVVIKNSVINLVYQIFPIITALIMVPITIKKLGKEFFAIYTLCITIIVLFNYFNFGVAFSATKEISKCFDKPDLNKKASSIFNSSLLLMILISLPIAIFGYLFAPSLANLLVSQNDSIYYKDLAATMFRGIALSSPIFLLVILLRGVLEGYQVFKVTSFNRAVLSSALFLFPGLAVLGLTNEFGIILCLILVYSLSFLFLLNNIKQVIGVSINFYDVDFSQAKSLLLSGMWMTIATVVAVLFYYSDRFVIGATTGLVPLSYYVASYDLISKLTIVSGSLSASLYPAVSNWKSTQNSYLISSSFLFYGKAVSLLIFPVTLFFATFSKEILALWINQEFSDNSALVLSVLAIGLFFNCLAAVPIKVLFGLDKERLVAVFYVLISIPYTAILIFLLLRFGITGAAYAYLFRAFTEYLGLHVFLLKAEQIKSFNGFQPYILSTFALYAPCLFLGLLLINAPLVFKLAIYTIALALCLYINYSHIFTSTDREKIKGLIRPEAKSKAAAKEKLKK